MPTQNEIKLLDQMREIARVKNNPRVKMECEIYEEAKGGGWIVTTDSELCALRIFYKYRNTPGVRFGTGMIENENRWYVATSTQPE